MESDNLRGARAGDRAPARASGTGGSRCSPAAPDLESAKLREQGYREALAAAGVPFDESLVRVGGYDADVSADAARALLDRPDRPTAVFASNDVAAIATIEVRAELGLRVPRDLSVVGFDNIPESALCTPPADHGEPADPARWASAAVELLIRLIRGAAVERTHLTLATELVVRGSTAPACGTP